MAGKKKMARKKGRHLIFVFNRPANKKAEITPSGALNST